MVNRQGQNGWSVARSDGQGLAEGLLVHGAAWSPDGGRVAYPEEIAGIVATLCHPEASYQTGCLVSANGGQWMSS